MSTFLKATAVVGLLLILTGSAQALVFSNESNLGTLGVDPQYDGAYSGSATWPTVTGGGSAIGGTSDHGYFVYDELAGDGEIIVQVFGFAGSGTSPDRKGGLMIRDSMDEDAINLANLVSARTSAGNNVILAQTRLETGGDTSTVSSMGAPAGSIGVTPWIKLERSGNVFKASYSKFGSSWELLAEETVIMDGSVFVGLAVTAHNNDETETVTFRSPSYTGFRTPGALTWNESGDDFWDTANWDTPPPNWPDRYTAAILADTNTDTVTVRTAAEALTLDVLGGELVIDEDDSLTVFGSANFDTDTYLEMNKNTALTVFGGVIPNMFADKGNVTVATASDLLVSNLDGHGIIAGTFTKEGAGKLQLDNSSGASVFADSTTFSVQQGTLASAGEDPLGNAMGVILGSGTLLDLANNPGAINMATGVTVDGSAEVSVDTTGGASLGALTLNDDLMTSGGGGVSFDSTTASASVTIYTDIDTTTGPITAPGQTITKDGPDMLIVTGVGDVNGATFRVEDGELVGVYGSNPFEGAALVGAGGTIVLATAAGSPATFDNALSLTEHSDLIGGGVGSGETVVLGSGTNGVSLNDRQLYVGTIDGYTLEIAGAIADTSGEIRMTEGLVNVTGGGGGGSTDLRTVGSGTLNVNGALLTLDDLRTYDGTLNIQSEVVVVDNLEVHDGLLATTAKLTADDVFIEGGTMTTGADLVITDYIEVSSGAATTNAAVNSSADPAPYVEVTGGSLDMTAVAYAEEVVVTGGLAGAAELVISDSLVQGVNTYSIDTGTFTARGPDLLNAVDLEFGGNKLTVAPPGPTTVADSSGNGYDGDRHGGSFTDDVPAVLAGGRAINFNDGDNYVIVDTGGSQDVFDLDQLTVAFWQKEWPDGNWEPMVSKRGESGQGWQVRRRGSSSDNMAFTLRGTSDEDAEAKDAWVKDGEWHHVVATYDGATRDIYIDGGLWDSDAVTGTVNDTGAALVFGARNNSDSDLGNIGDYSHVLLDDIYIYDRAIIQADVDALVANSGISTAGLLGSWTFDDLPPVVDLPSTNLLVTDDSILEAMVTESVTFGDLELASGVELELVTEAPYGMSFDDLTAGDGASILGDMTVRGDMSVGDSPGGLLVSGNLALGDGSVYTWDLEAGGGDLITVTGDLDILADWTLEIRTGQPFVRGEHKLFTYGGDLIFDAPQDIDVSLAPGWPDDDRLRVFNRDDDVMLDVIPEPATWILLLTAGLIGLVACARRRRRA